MKVLIIPEDPSTDQFILKPIVQALFDDLKPNARIAVLQEPRLRGAAQALDREMIKEIIDSNPMEDLFLLLIDRDCNREHHVEKAAARESEHNDRLIVCLAEQEIEVWMLALHKDGLEGIRWREVRTHCDPKEAWADPFLYKQGRLGPGGGRKAAMQALRGNLKTLLELCPELSELRTRIKAWMDAQAGS